MPKKPQIITDFKLIIFRSNGKYYMTETVRLKLDLHFHSSINMMDVKDWVRQNKSDYLDMKFVIFVNHDLGYPMLIKKKYVRP